MFNTSALHIILSLLDSGKLQKAHCQPYRTLMQLRLSKHFVERIFATAVCCRHTTTPCYTTGKLSHDETKWLGQKSFSENNGRAKRKPDGLNSVSIMNQLIIFSLSVIFQGHSKHVEFCFDTSEAWLFFLLSSYIFHLYHLQKFSKLQFNLAFVVLQWNREDLMKLIFHPIHSEEWILLYCATINIDCITWKCKGLHLYIFHEPVFYKEPLFIIATEYDQRSESLK